MTPEQVQDIFKELQKQDEETINMVREACSEIRDIASCKGVMNEVFTFHEQYWLMENAAKVRTFIAQCEAEETDFTIKLVKGDL